MPAMRFNHGGNRSNRRKWFRIHLVRMRCGRLHGAVACKAAGAGRLSFARVRAGPRKAARRPTPQCIDKQRSETEATLPRHVSSHAAITAGISKEGGEGSRLRREEGDETHRPSHDFTSPGRLCAINGPSARPSGTPIDSPFCAPIFRPARGLSG